MKKLFLIPLMALMCSVMAMAADQHVSDIAGLKAAIADASVETIYLDADIQYQATAGSSCINILRSVTIDGQGHTLAGYGQRGTSGNYPTVAINQGGSSLVDVTLKNLQMINPMLRVVETRGNIHSVTIENCHIEALRANNSGYDQPITIGGNQSTSANITIRNSKVIAPVYYPVVVFNPINLTLENTEIEGWCSVYFKGKDSSAGSRGSVMVADDCHFNAPNIYSGETNAFAMFPLEDDGISITLNNCGMDAEHFGDQPQDILSLSNNAAKARRTQAVSLTITGDNTYINSTLLNNCWAAGMVSKTDYSAPIPDPHPLSITISGGTYMFNPDEAWWYKNSKLEEPDKSAEANIGRVTIPDGYEVKEITTQQGKVTTKLYRVRKTIEDKTKNINADEEEKGDGQNAETQFEISSDQSVGTAEVDKVIANYVEVTDNATLTVPTGKELAVTNGLDVTDGAQVVVEAGSTIKVGEGGITAESTESIVIEADEKGAASLLLDPEVIINTTPSLTVKMLAKQIGRKDGDFYWHRYAMPVAHIESWEKEGEWDPSPAITYPTYVYAWDYDENDWKSITPNLMVPLQGYTLTLASNWINADGTDTDEENGTLNELQDVTYTFKGNLVGNTDQPLNFQHEGFNYFGNSYTGYMHVKTMLQGLENGNIDGTAYMWCNDPDDEDGNYQNYVGVSLYKLINQGNRLEDWQKEVAPMQTFILRLRGADSADESVNYASAIWGNPRYGNSSSPAPHRALATISEDTYMEIVVKAANGKGSRVDFTESANNSDAFESGYDVEKYMNEKTINLYATVNDVNLSSVVTDNLLGKTLSLKTNNEIAYTMSFKNVEGAEYAIRDNVTGQVYAIEEGASFGFAAQPNSTAENRFEIVSIHKVPTAVENTESAAKAHGIYTMLGQYVGEDFNALPAGVYVVNGVKIVK